MPQVLAALARHGQYEQPEAVPSALLPYGLTDEGRASARRMADDLMAFADARGLQLDSVIECSTLRRAWETAETVAQVLAARLGSSMQVVQHEDLCERSLGAAANLTVQEIEAIIAADPRYQPLPAEWKVNPHVRLPLAGAESLHEAGARVAQHLEARLAALEARATTDTLALFVGHGAALRHAAAALGILTPQQIPELSMHHCRPVYVTRIAPGRFAQVAGEFKIRSAREAQD